MSQSLGFFVGGAASWGSCWKVEVDGFAGTLLRLFQLSRVTFDISSQSGGLLGFDIMAAGLCVFSSFWDVGPTTAPYGSEPWPMGGRWFQCCGKVENRGIYHGKSKIFVDYGWTSGPRASNVLPTRGEQRFVSTFLR